MLNPLEKINEYCFRLPKAYKPGMRVDGIVYSCENLLEGLLKDKALEQVANVAFLPGIVKASLAMPDIHWGYGFAIGGVAATNIDKSGVISPGGVGFDINCGVRLVKTGLFHKEITKYLPELMKELYHIVPAGVGSKGDIRLNKKEQRKILAKGAAWAIGQGFGTKEDLEFTEENGCMSNAEVAVLLKISPASVSKYLQQWEFEHDELVPRRGTIHDLGPTLTHKKPIIRKLFLEGKSVEQVARETRHSPEAIHRYIRNFKQVLLCQQKKLTEKETAFAIKISSRLVREYYALIEEFREQNSVLNEVLKYTNKKL